jgi:hypothetical protein
MIAAASPAEDAITPASPLMPPAPADFSSLRLMFLSIRPIFIALPTLSPLRPPDFLSPLSMPRH